MAYLIHYGTPRHSGRYPYGSGKNPFQSEKAMVSHIEKLRKEGKTDKDIAAEFVKDDTGFYRYVRAMSSLGVSDKDIAEAFGRNTTWLRQKKSIAREHKRAEELVIASKMRDKGYSHREIAEHLGLPNESTVRTMLQKKDERKKIAVETTADGLREVLKQHQFVDVGRGCEALIGVSSTRLGTAVRLLQDEGYQVFTPQVKQAGTNFKTNMKVLGPPGTTIKDVYAALNQNEIPLASGFKVVDNGQKIKFMEDPVSVDSKRVAIRYAEEGGAQRDGLIELRRGVPDLAMGDSTYAQVRILVDGDHYLKGMAVYSDDLPPGVDIRFNTNKHTGTDKMDVLKGIKRNKDGTPQEENLFGAAICAQPTYLDKDGKEHQGAINIVNAEGDWADWKKTISSQMLSKQPVAVATERLNATYASKKQEYDEIMALTNPTVKKILLDEFASECDSATVHLKAQGFIGQASHVILPVVSLKENEVYAPRYEDGSEVVLIRFPHAGTFEIPELKVNNKNKEAIGMMGKTPKDAIGIDSGTAQILSGADFDGDTVLVIPNNDHKIQWSKPLKELANFDPGAVYPAYEGMKKVGPDREAGQDGFRKGREMGDVSNLITDMQIKGANPSEIARAVRYSMVVIDAEKHQYNWKLAYEQENIADLKKRYQGSTRAGASTLISRAKGEAHVEARSLRKDIDPETGDIIYHPLEGDKAMRWQLDKKTGEWTQVPRKTKSTKMTEAFASGKDATSLISQGGSDIETAYASYANRVHTLANEARKESIAQPSVKVSPSAKQVYAKEVESLTQKVVESKKNAAYERQVNTLVNSQFRLIKKDNPDMDYEEEKKVKSQLQRRARSIVKGDENKSRIDVTEKEWEAIQAGAITNTMLLTILQKADMDTIKKYATPRVEDTKLSTSQISAIKNKMQSGRYTTAEIASQYGISTSTIYKLIE